MKSDGNEIPLSTSLTGIYRKDVARRKTPVDKRVFYLSIQVIFNAIVIGIVAKGLVFLIDGITNLAFYGKFSLGATSPAGNHLGLAVIIVPIVGGVIVGFMARYGSKAIGGHGIPEAMEKIILDESRIPPALTFLKPLSAAISIGTGGPFGAEGPIIATGGAFGSLTGQWMHISPGERKIVLAAGACAGMAAIFGSPLASVLLAVELLLFEFSPRSVIPVGLACVTGAGMHFLLFGTQPVFQMPQIPVPGTWTLAIYVLMGALVGVIASMVSRSVYWIEDMFERLPVHWMWFPAIGAIAIGVVGYFSPKTMGVGYDNIKWLLQGGAPLAVMATLGLLKYISWSISLGSGTSGGTLAPLFTIGGALGAVIGGVLLRFFPLSHINIATAALVGMAAMFAGASRAWLTSIVFALETTGQMNGLLPLLGACLAAYFVSFFLMKGTIMTEKIHRRGVKTPDAYEPDALQTVTVRELMTQPVGAVDHFPSCFASDDAGLAAEVMGQYNKDIIAVKEDPEEGSKEREESNKEREDGKEEMSDGETDKDQAKEEGQEEGKIIGVITAQSILNFYSEKRQKSEGYQSPNRKTRRILAQGRRILRTYKN